MTDSSDTAQYPPPDPERVERALRAMHARRRKLRNARIIGFTSTLAVIACVAVAALVTTSGGRPLQVVGHSSTTTSAVTEPTTTAPTTTTTTTQPTETTTTLPGTQQITYQPFTATGAIVSGLRVTSNATGTCLTGENSRSYRCFSVPSGGIYDPCFAGPHGTSLPLICPRNPAIPDVVEFTATAVTSTPPITTTRPWAMQLSGGQVCIFVSAAWGGLGPYGCQTNNASTTPADCRQPQPSQPWWAADCQGQETDTSPFSSYRVSRVWF